ncbi:hypothetical protein [Streptomyces sp. 35G-GA-8]|uniref:hypothetical protein n=1 Tax=Streptomyces sp. 35G-GA-8 TaxID=2939434 RepID=UPI00201F3433|nr:hypothetical protein [Streptomyces sp. 35G-GA-8]MCL7382144.1 hypothetical protein [Streptomyces sp. 35G-GA-8]
MDLQRLAVITGQAALQGPRFDGVAVNRTADGPRGSGPGDAQPQLTRCPGIGVASQQCRMCKPLLQHPHWLRSSSAAAFVDEFQQHLVINSLVDVHEK